MKAEDVQGDLTEVLFTREEIEAKIAELRALVSEREQLEEAWLENAVD